MKNKEALVVLEEVAHRLKESAEEIVDATSEFDDGRLVGYYEALSTIVSQCLAMDLPLEDIKLAGFDPDSLIGVRNPEPTRKTA